MAQSRLEKIGTIFTRVTSLMKGGAMRLDDKPLWYDVYATFPPKIEPRYDRVAPNLTIRDIFYEEDIIRARFQEEHGKSLTVNLSMKNMSSRSQRFISIYQGLQQSGAPESQIYEQAIDKYSREVTKFELDKKQNPLPEVRQKPLEKVAKLNLNVSDIFKE